MDQYYHRTNNIDAIVTSGRVQALKHLARSNPDLEVEVESGASGSNFGGLASNRETLRAADAYDKMKGVKDVDRIFVTKSVLPPVSYGKYIIEKKLRSTKENVKLNLIPNEHTTGRSLSVRSNANIYVPDDEHEYLSNKFSSTNFMPMSQLKARQATLTDRAKSLYRKLTKSADVKTLFSGTEKDIQKLLSRNATIVGSEGIGINVEGASDRDILVPYKTKQGFNRLVKKLEDDGLGLKESPYNARKRDGFKVYSYKDNDVDVDVALVHGGKASDLTKHIRHLRETLSDEQRSEIISKKKSLQNAWFFRDSRYKNYKRGIDRKLGLTQFHE